MLWISVSLSRVISPSLVRTSIGYFFSSNNLRYICPSSQLKFWKVWTLPTYQHADSETSQAGRGCGYEASAFWSWCSGGWFQRCFRRCGDWFQRCLLSCGPFLTVPFLVFGAGAYAGEDGLSDVHGHHAGLVPRYVAVATLSALVERHGVGVCVSRRDVRPGKAWCSV